jgi:hypothetical protein
MKFIFVFFNLIILTLQKIYDIYITKINIHN